MRTWDVEDDAQETTEVRLTPREVEVLGQLAMGKPSSQIAEELFVSRRTIDFHIRQIYEKLGVHNRMAAYQQAVRLGFVPAFSP